MARRALRSLLGGFASIGEGMADLVCPPSREQWQSRLDADYERITGRRRPQSTTEALCSDWATVQADLDRATRRHGYESFDAALDEDRRRRGR